MRLLTFSFLRSFKFRQVYIPRRLRSDVDVVQPEVEDNIKGDSSLVDASEWAADERPALRGAALRDMQVLPDFVSPAEEAALLDELEPVLRRMRYEFDHWDNAIHGFRETERAEWRAGNAAVLRRVRALAFPAGGAGEGGALPHAHVLDLAPSGHIKPHVDAVRFCGDVIAGLCLLSSAVMRLQHSAHAHLAFRALLPRRALYVMRGVSRYEFTHAVSGGEWRGERVARGRRVAVILRARPSPHGDVTPPAAHP